jgi:hypothetical protein
LTDTHGDRIESHADEEPLHRCLFTLSNEQADWQRIWDRENHASLDDAHALGRLLISREEARWVQVQARQGEEYVTLAVYKRRHGSGGHDPERFWEGGACWFRRRVGMNPFGTVRGRRALGRWGVWTGEELQESPVNLARIEMRGRALCWPPWDRIEFVEAGVPLIAIEWNRRKRAPERVAVESCSSGIEMS